MECIEELLTEWKASLKESDVPGNEAHTTWVNGIVRGIELALERAEQKNNKQMQTDACTCPDPEGCLYLTGTDTIKCGFNKSGTAD